MFVSTNMVNLTLKQLRLIAIYWDIKGYKKCLKINY